MNNAIAAPEALQKLNQWVVWRYEERPGDPKPAKVPYNPKVKHIKKEGWQPVKNNKGFIAPEYSGGAKSNGVKTWGMYQEALKAYESGIFNGLGVMLHDGLCGIDIDGCLENNMLIGPAKGILDIMDTYAEYSPSGTGIHLLFFGQVKEDKSLYKKNPRTGVEIYSKGRYFTFTGKALNDKNVEERSIQIEQVQLEYMQKEEKKKTVAYEPEIILSDIEMINIASRAKNGQTFQKLWSGDFSNYSSQSEADLALCNILSFYTGADAGRIDNLFRQSGLYREKWEREDYRNDTINKAIAATKEVYKPNRKQSKYNKNMSDIENGDLKLGVSETPRGYVHKSIDGRSGDVVTKILSNFIIDIKEMIVNDEEVLITAVVGNQAYKVEKTFDVKAFDNKGKFLEAISDINFFFKGKEDQLQDIKHIVSKKDYKFLTGLNYTGFNKVNNKFTFATDTKVIDCKLNPVHDVVIPKEKVIMKSNILEINGITREELQKISPYLFNFNSIEITSSIWGTLPTFFLKPLWFDHGIRTKHLFMWGESGSGKSETKRIIILPFFSMQDNVSISCDNISQFSFNKYTENSNVFPVILEEYKPWEMSPQNISIVSAGLRNTYDMSNGIRGTKDQKLNIYPQISTVVCVGEAPRDETAVKERSMIVNFSRVESRTPEREKAYKTICETQNKILIQKLGRSILNIICELGIEKIMELRKTIEEHKLATLPDNRVNDTVLNAIVGINLFRMLYKQLGLDFEKATGYKAAEIYQAINKNCFNTIMDGSRKSKTTTDKTIELISTMKAHGYIQENRHYAFVNGYSELALNINLLFDNITKYIKDYAVEGEYSTNKTQFCKQLQKTEYFIAKKAVRYTYYNSDFLQIGENSTVIKSYVLDISRLREAELDVDDLLQ